MITLAGLIVGAVAGFAVGWVGHEFYAWSHVRRWLHSSAGKRYLRMAAAARQAEQEGTDR